jgi:hypothetical protein
MTLGSQVCYQEHASSRTRRKLDREHRYSSLLAWKLLGCLAERMHEGMCARPCVEMHYSVSCTGHGVAIRGHEMHSPRLWISDQLHSWQCLCCELGVCVTPRGGGCLMRFARVFANVRALTRAVKLRLSQVKAIVGLKLGQIINT